MVDDEIQELLERLQHNEEIARKFFAVEASILSIFNFKDLFERLLTEIRERFEIPYVWITLIDESNAAHLIRELETSEVLKRRLNVLDKASFFGLIGVTGKPVLVNRDLNPFYKVFPQNETYLIRSLAVAPIMLDGEIIGSLNHGDSSPLRYNPGMDTTLLERLAVKVSICMANVVAHEKIRLVASRDPLTGLLNRRVMEAVLKREFNRSLRYPSSLSVVFLDLDDFKSVNDRYGHDAGDALLKYLGDSLVGISRESDVVARFAGDEFVIILPSTPLQDAHTLSERMIAYLQNHPLQYDGHSIPVSVSYGIGNNSEPFVTDPPSLLKLADRRLLEAKGRKGKGNRVLSLERVSSDPSLV
jgi:diguanylate cyclase (GGDEF)-like protein